MCAPWPRRQRPGSETVADELRPAIPTDHDELYSPPMRRSSTPVMGTLMRRPFPAMSLTIIGSPTPRRSGSPSVDGAVDLGRTTSSRISSGRAAHISNAGYFVLDGHIGARGLGRKMVEHSLHEARRLGFDAMQFNLVFASNPGSCHLYRRAWLSSRLGRVPAAVDGDDAVIYWRSPDPEGI
jgi:hypothetical protein